MFKNLPSLKKSKSVQKERCVFKKSVVYTQSFLNSKNSVKNYKISYAPINLCVRDGS